jgi:hypothetical protein
MYAPLGPFPWHLRRKPLSLKSAWIVRPALKFAPRRQSDLRQNREWEAFNVYHARSTALSKLVIQELANDLSIGMESLSVTSHFSVTKMSRRSLVKIMKKLFEDH